MTFDPGPFDFSASFNRDVTDADVQMMFVPQPISMGTVATHGRTYDRLDVEFRSSESQNQFAHWILLDGPNFLRPYLIRLFTGDASGDYDFPNPDIPCLVVGDLGQIGQMDGEIGTPPGGPDPENTLVYAYLADGLGSDPDPSLIFFVAQPVAVTMATHAANKPGDWAYRVNQLQIYERYTVIAVLDTSGDGIYDPTEDWWGYPQDPASRRLTYAEAHIDACTPKLDRVELRRPIGSSPAP